MQIIFSQLWQLFGYRLCVWARDGNVAKRQMDRVGLWCESYHRDSYFVL